MRQANGIQFHSLAVEPVEHIAWNMREWDRREIFATRNDNNPHTLAQECVSYSAFGFWLPDRSGAPCAAFGAIQIWPGVLSVWCFGTDNFHHAGKTLTKHLKRTIIPTFKKAVHRAQCFSIDGHVEAQRWLETLGAEREATLHDFGRERETFHLYAWRT